MAVRQILRNTFEFIKETTNKGAQIVPDVASGMWEQAVKGGQLSAAQKQQIQQQQQQQISQKAQQHQVTDESDLKKTREALAQLQRMKQQWAPKGPPTLRPYEQTVQNMERTKAIAVENHKKSSTVAAPTSVQPRGMLFGKRKTKGIEGFAKDTKIG